MLSPTNIRQLTNIYRHLLLANLSNGDQAMNLNPIGFPVEMDNREAAGATKPIGYLAAMDSRVECGATSLTIFPAMMGSQAGIGVPILSSLLVGMDGPKTGLDRWAKTQYLILTNRLSIYLLINRLRKITPRVHLLLAEGVGFEPTVPFPARRFSRPFP